MMDKEEVGFLFSVGERGQKTDGCSSQALTDTDSGPVSGLIFRRKESRKSVMKYPR